jgi:SMC interacting uncharacterized protein involved in chromosome segregation
MTDVSLREHLERQIADLARRIDQRFAATEQAVMKAEQMMNERLAGMNEFRDALRDQSHQFAARADVTRTEQQINLMQQQMATRIEMEKLDGQINELQRARANLDGRLLVLAGGLSIVTSLAIWMLTQVLSQ